MRKSYTLGILILALSGKIFAQPACTNCTVTSAAGTVLGSGASVSIPVSNHHTFDGQIQLDGACVISVSGTGHYTLSGTIISAAGATTSLTYRAPDAGWTGHAAGITLSGNAPNTYTGLTTIACGYLICNKTGGRAIPGEVKISASAVNLAARLWCRADNQLNSTSAVDFSGALSMSLLHLNGTTQTVRGLTATNNLAGVVNTNNWYSPDGFDLTLPPGISATTATAGILNIAGGSEPYTFEGGSILGPLTFPTSLTVSVITGTQIIKNRSTVAGVTLSSDTGAALEFNSTLGTAANPATPVVGGHVIFKGGGTIIKTGAGSVEVTSSRILKSGYIQVAGGVFVNGRGDEGNNNSYAFGTETNTANLIMEASGTFDLWGGDAIFNELSGDGIVQNSRRSGSRYSLLTLGRDGLGNPIFRGVINDNSTYAAVTATTGSGVALRKVGNGIQVLRGENLYTGPTTVSSGTLKLEEEARLGRGVWEWGWENRESTYAGDIEISNVLSGASQAIFEHNGGTVQVFTGNITNRIGTGTPGKFIQSGYYGKSIINRAADFKGEVSITNGFLGGSGDLRNARSVVVSSEGSIGGGYGKRQGSNSIIRRGATLTVSGLIFATAPYGNAQLIVSSRPESNSPSLVEVKARETDNPGEISITNPNGLRVAVRSTTTLQSGYILKCSNGLRDHLPLPSLHENTTEKGVAFKWDNTGLYMTVGTGLICDNCSFDGPEGVVTGTTENPATILPLPNNPFTGEIRLNGPCRFTILGSGNYTLSGQIITALSAAGPTPLTYYAPGEADYSDNAGLGAGFTLEGDNPNTYTGTTTIAGGYLICKKSTGGAVPGIINPAAETTTYLSAHLWCQADNQLNNASVIDFSNARGNSYLHLNGTTQTVAGIVSNNPYAWVDNRLNGIDYRPVGITALSAENGTLNIVAGGEVRIFESANISKRSNNYSYGTDSSPELTLNVKSGTQVIQPYTTNSVKEVTLMSMDDATLEFRNTAHLTINEVVFKGNGTIKKSGPNNLYISNSRIIKSGGKIWVFEGTLAGHNTTYEHAGVVNQAGLQVDPPATDAGNNIPTFDIFGSRNSIFSGLTGGGLVQNSSYQVSTADIKELTLGQTHADATFNGIIRDNSQDNYYYSSNSRKITLTKVGTGTQILTGENLYTGSTTVSSGTLKLQGDGRLGTKNNSGVYTGSYAGALEISNLPAGNPAVFEHNGDKTQVFSGDITNPGPTGTGAILGTFLQSGSGKSILIATGPQTFSGNISITNGFLGGAANLNQTTGVSVGAGGSMGRGYGVTADNPPAVAGEGPAGSGSGALTVSGLSFAAATSKLIVTPRYSGNSSPPGLVEVKTRGTLNPGTITAAAGFTVVVVGDNLLSGYILKCAPDNRPDISLIRFENHTGKPLAIRWRAEGLFMDIGGLTCDNCTFISVITGASVTAVPGDEHGPAIILSDNHEPREFTGHIQLNGPCHFAISGLGSYTLSGQIISAANFIPITDRPYGLKLSAPSAGGTGGKGAGIILAGTSPNTYSGETIIEGGFIACRKSPNTIAIPGNIKLKTTTSGLESGLWFMSNNEQLSSACVLTFETAGNAKAILALNGTTQKFFGINASTANCIIENNEPNQNYLIPLTSIDANTKSHLVLTGITGSYTIGGGAVIRAGGNGSTDNAGLEVQIEGTSQKIVVPDGVVTGSNSSMKDLTIDVRAGGRLELNSPHSGNIFSTPASLIFKGAGTFVKTGPGAIWAYKFMHGGHIQVNGGTLDIREGSKLGGEQPYYSGMLSIESGATFAHNSNSMVAELRGAITGTGTLLREEKSGKTLISGDIKDFAGTVQAEGLGFIGGFGNISKASFVVTGSGRIGGGTGVPGRGGAFTVGDLTFATLNAGLLVTPGENHAPAVVEVKTRGTNNPGRVTLANNKFTVIIEGDDLVSGCILKCSNSGAERFDPVSSITTINSTGKQATYAWGEEGLYLTLIGGLTCDNCAFGPQNALTIGIPGDPVLISNTPDQPFTQEISLRNAEDKPCNFAITGTGNYTLSGRITGTGRLVYKAMNAGHTGHSAGITLSGGESNDYTGSTTIAGGFVVCNKSNHATAVPGTIKISAGTPTVQAHLWCQAGNQLSSSSVVDFSGAQNNSRFHLNGTIQEVRGLVSDNNLSFVDNHLNSEGTRPNGMAPLNTGPGILNLNGTAGLENCLFKGGSIFRGGSAALTINVVGGTQIIQDISGTVREVTLTSADGAILELNATILSEFGSSVLLKGEGIIKKSEDGIMELPASVLKTGGKIWVSKGILRNRLNNNYTEGDESNKATLQVDGASVHAAEIPVFDLWGGNSIFDGLTGGGYVQNNLASSASSTEGGYNSLTLGQNNSPASSFTGVIRDNSTGAGVTMGTGTGGIALTKTGTGTQMLAGENRYTGSTTVSSGTLKLQGGGQLGRGSYAGRLEISNVAAGATPAIFEHGGEITQVFIGDMTNTTGPTGAGVMAGTYLQSGTGKSLIAGTTPKAFTGNVRIRNGFLGGSGDLRNAAGVTVEAGGSVGGGNNESGGGDTFTVSGLTFAAAASTLKVTAMPNYKPGLVNVKARGTDIRGEIIAANGFTVLVADNNVVSGYILKCSNTIPHEQITLLNHTEKAGSVTWKEEGLYLNIGGLTCDNCSFFSEGRGRVEGTTVKPALILTDGEQREFSGDITLNGACNLLISGTGNYILSGKITGTGPLTYKAPNSDNQGLTTGITLRGSASNTYTELTTLTGGYLICNKENDRASVPGNIKISASGEGTATAHLWCQSHNQLNGAVIDFTDAGRSSCFHLNGTTQTIGGLVANYHTAQVNNHSGSLPAGMGSLSSNPALLNIVAGSGSYTYENGVISAGAGAPALTIAAKTGTQILRNDPRNTPLSVSDVTLTSEAGANLVVDNGISGSYRWGDRIVYRGAGIIKKSGAGTIVMRSNTILKTGGKIWVTDGILQNFSDNLYTLDTESNRAVLEVDAPNESNHNPTFDLWGSNVIFAGLTGGGRVQNNWSPADGASGGGHKNLILNPNDTRNPVIFDGIIGDNATNDPAHAGTSGRGGINLKKEGAGTQILTEKNLYTGSTTVSSGTLKLQGEGRLGKINAQGSYQGIYQGILEISNAPAATPAIFEYNGAATQVLAGNITNATPTGEGTVLGTFLQSGSGKSIINGGEKTFTGNVSVTGGFLGGTGDLRNATAVTVGAAGSIGGGYGVAANGGTLIVAGLNFAASNAILRVTSTTAENNPSLVNVLNRAGASGTISAEAGFRVDMMENDLVSGYILKCSNGLSDHLPLPVLIENNTEKVVWFKWDNMGLWMEIGTGITLSANAGCPKGINPVNLPVVVTVVYPNPPDDHYIPPGAVLNFSLSDSRAISGNLTTSRNGNTITATFNGANPTTIDLPYKIKLNYSYEDKRYFVEQEAKINPQPVVSLSSSNSFVCTGTAFELQASGNAPVKISSTDAGTIVTPDISPATATTTSVGQVNFLATDTDGCKSEYFPVSVKLTPLALADSEASESVCMGDIVTLAVDVQALTYQWLKDGVAISGATTNPYNVPVGEEESNITYSIAITNDCGERTAVVKKVKVTPDAYFADGSPVTNPTSTAEVGKAVTYTYNYNTGATDVEYLWDFDDNTFTPSIRTTCHSYYKTGTYHPTLKVTKPGQEACSKTFAPLSLEITGKEVGFYTRDPNQAGFSVYPIPAQSRLTIVTNDNLQHISISDISGKTVLNKAVNGRKATLSIEHLANGIYLLTVTEAKGVRYLKIAKN